MFNLIEYSHRVQTAICMLVSVVIVSGSLSLAAYGAKPEPLGYSVTITQLQ
jgi:hypothetical protein